jgi:hypothetical protein
MNFETFNEDPLREGLVREWNERSKRNEPNESPFQTFTGFIEVWVGFNAWAACVTQEDSDAEMIKRLASNRILNDVFASLIRNNPEFLVAVRNFSHFWPIFSFTSARKLRLENVFRDFSRDEARQKLLEANVKRGPEGSYNRELPSWRDTIQAVYRVRCNLIHGNKGSAPLDFQIVGSAYKVLSMTIDLGQLYNLGRT